MITVFLQASNLPALKFPLGRFTIIRTMTRRVPGAFIFSKLLTAKLADFEFLLYRIILIGFKSFKGITFSLVAVLNIHIRFKPLQRGHSLLGTFLCPSQLCLWSRFWVPGQGSPGHKGCPLELCFLGLCLGF